MTTSPGIIYCMLLKMSLSPCGVLQVGPLPSRAQRRVHGGHVHHSSGSESQYAHLCGSYRHAANGPSWRRDGHGQRSDTIHWLWSSRLHRDISCNDSKQPHGGVIILSFILLPIALNDPSQKWTRFTIVWAEIL